MGKPTSTKGEKPRSVESAIRVSSACSFDFLLPVAQLRVDESGMREFVGYGDSINDSDRAEIQENMLDTNQLNVNSHSDIWFLSDSCTLVDSEKLEVTGVMSIVGSEQTVTLEIDINAQLDAFYAAGQFDFTHSDFGLTPFSAFGGLVRNGEALRISFDLVGFANE